MSFDDDADEDAPRYSQPPHQDDRLWRHPSELAGRRSEPDGASVDHVPRLEPAAGDGGWRAVAGAGALGVAVVTAVVTAVVAAVVVSGVSGDTTMTDGNAAAVMSGDGRGDGGGNQATEPAAGAAARAAARVAAAVVGLDGGSGVVLRPGGVVLTSSSLVDGGAVRVRVATGTTVEARVVGIDEVTGLAVLDLPNGRHPTAEPSAAEAEPGTTAYSVHATRRPDGTAALNGDGSEGPQEAPAGDGTSSTSSTVRGTSSTSSTVGGTSSTGGTGAVGGDGGAGVAGADDTAAAQPGVVGTGDRARTTDGLRLEGVVQLAGPAGALALGGPVVDGDGVVLGITTVVDGDRSSYLTPVDVAEKVADDLVEWGRAHHSWLGIEGRDHATVAGTGESSDPGAEVVMVAPGSPAEAAGIRVGDVIVGFGDHEVAQMPDLIRRLLSQSPGDEVTVTVKRDGEVVDLTATLEERAY